MFRPEHAIETTRLTLRSFTPGDFGDLYAYPDHHGRGLAAEAAEAMLVLGFGTEVCQPRVHKQ